MYKKIAFISMNLLTNWNMYGKGMALIGLSFIYTLKMSFSKPFVLMDLNSIEYLSNISSTTTILFGIVYLDSTENNLSILWFMIVVLLSLNFICQWAIKFLRLIYVLHYKTLKKLGGVILKRIFSIFGEKASGNLKKKTKKAQRKMLNSAPKNKDFSLR